MTSETTADEAHLDLNGTRVWLRSPPVPEDAKSWRYMPREQQNAITLVDDRSVDVRMRDGVVWRVPLEEVSRRVLVARLDAHWYLWFRRVPRRRGLLLFRFAVYAPSTEHAAPAMYA